METSTQAAGAAGAEVRANSNTNSSDTVARSKRRAPTHEELFASALEYIERGWCVFPLAEGQKVPPKGSKGVLEATTDKLKVEAWWGTWMPYANVAIGTGERSNLFVLDIDPRHGGDTVIKKLQEEHGTLPRTITVHTGGGGFQFYFKAIPGARNSANKIGLKYAFMQDERGRPISGIDTRGNGGYIVAPPSLHPSGGVYYFHHTSKLQLDPANCALAEAPDWLKKAALDNSVTTEGGKVVARPNLFRSIFKFGAGQGERNDTATKLAGYLFRSNIDSLMVADIMTLWNDARVNPPLSEKELKTILDSVSKKELSRINQRRIVR